MNPLAVAVQGLGFGPAMVAVQGLLLWVAQEVQRYEAQGGDAPVRRTRARRELLGVVVQKASKARTRAAREREFAALL